MQYNYTICDVCLAEITPDKLKSEKKHIDVIYMTDTDSARAADICIDCMAELDHVISKIRLTPKAGENKKKVPARYFAMKKK